MDVPSIATRLAAAVKREETEARRQLLSGHDRAIDVEFKFQPGVAPDAPGTGKKGTLKDVVDYFRDLRPQRMVITGVAGSGKTVLATALNFPAFCPIPGGLTW